jgi:hypothetical protein
VVKINSYEELRHLPNKSVVQDSRGRVWCVQHHLFGQTRETWLSSFSDEYSFHVKDDSTYALGEMPILPIVDLNVVDRDGG